MLTLAACDVGLLLGEGEVVARLDQNSIIEGRANPAQFEFSMIANLRKHSRWT
jgi:hypothetical protein